MASDLKTSIDAERDPDSDSVITQNNDGDSLKIGPGLITGACDDDPSGIATYSLAGATFGLSMLWTAPLFFPLMASVEYICAKVAMVSGTGLAGVIKQNYQKPILYACVALLVIANTINAGTDIGAIAAATNLIFPQLSPLWITPAVALSILSLDLFGGYRLLSRVFKLLTLSLLSYFLCIFFVKLDIREVVMHTLIPDMRLDLNYVMMFIALFGTTISPYCLFWQASEEVEEEIEAGRNTPELRIGATRAELRSATLDVNLGMFLSILVMYSIMLTTGVTLDGTGFVQIDSAADAARALRPLAGEAASLLFAMGIIGTGFLAIPVLTDSAAYAVSEAFGVEPSLNETPDQNKLFYLVIVLSTLVGMAINYLGINPIQALFVTAVINGILVTPLLVMIMMISSNDTIMGENKNSALLNILGWTTTGISGIATLLLIGAYLMSFFTKT